MTIPAPAAIRAYLDASGWTRHPGPSWSRDGHHVDVPDDASPDKLAAVLAVIAHAEGRGSGDVARSVEALAEMRAQQPDVPALHGVTRYRVREPVVVEAIRWTGENEEAVRAFAGGHWDDSMPPCYAVRGITGHLFTVDADRFAATYEPAVSPPPVAAAFDREAVRGLVGAAIAKGWQDDDHLTELATGAIWPLLEHAQAALSDNEGVRLWMLDCGELVAKHRERAEAAEAKLAEIAEHCRTRPELAGAGYPQLAADILAIIGSEEGATPLRTSDQWAVAWGSEDVNDGIGRVEEYDDQEDAAEHLGRYGDGACVVSREVRWGPWRRVPAADDKEAPGA